MLKTSDGTQTKRLPGRIGDRYPTTGFQKKRALYTAVGGETSINLSLLSPPLSYVPNNSQIAVKRTSGGGPLIAGIDFYETSVSTIGFPTADPLLAGEIVEIMQDAMVTGIMAVTPSPECYSATATAGQTLITADFSWPYNLNPTKAIGGVRVEINGVTQTRNIDYTEVNLGSERTNQVIVTDSFVGGENIILLPAFQAIDTSAAASAFYGSVYSGMQSQIQAGTQAFVDQTTDMISVPNTTIVNRAKIPNLANDLRSSLGIDRVMTQSLMPLQNEFGFNGEPTYAVVNDDRNLIRFVGGWDQQYLEYNGPSRVSNVVGSYIEIVAYCTGLNVLSAPHNPSHSVALYVDGNLITSNIFSAVAYSGVLGNRNVSANIIVPVSSGLSLGIHTFKLVTNGGPNFYVSGFEILNNNSSGLININPGVGYNGGLKYTNTVYDSVAYNTGVTGTKGGRIVRYLNSDGTFSQAFTAVNTSEAYLALANHTNEDIARVHHWREFGAGRTANDEFSTIPSGTTGNRAFTLDDGTTSLLMYSPGSPSTAGIEGLTAWATGDYIVFTFVGTGLDIEMSASSLTGDTQTIILDGTTTLLTAGRLYNQLGKTIYKIASGLTYGTHTVKITTANGSLSDFYYHRFFIYQPKKPTIPSTSIEICDYNVMATFATNTTAGLETVATGVIRKSCSRELVYIGTWNFAFSASAYLGGFECNSNVSGNTMSYTFFGTGIDLRFNSANNRSTNISVQFNNLAATTANFPTLASSVYGLGVTFSGGVLSQYDAVGSSGAGCRISGLPLSIYTVKFINNTSSFMLIDAIDIITPIHSYKSNIYTDLQNTLPVGSNSLMDSRKTSMVKEILPSQKAWNQAIGFGTSPITTSSTSFVPIPGLSTTIKTSGGPLQIITVVDVYYPSSNKRATIAIFVDGERVSIPCSPQSFSTAGEGHINPCVTAIVPVSVGYHKIDIHWLSIDGTTIYSYLDANTNGRMLSVVEL